jgi:hypothetical protein
MKSKLWKTVKVHQWMIFGREDIGVIKAEIIEVDVKIVSQIPTFHYDYPYGLTKDTGIVKIRFEVDKVPREEIENLADLIAFRQAVFDELTKAYTDWRALQDEADSYKQAWQTLLLKKQQE